MRLSLASISLLTLFGALPAQGGAVLYTINFTGGPGGTPTGSFYYDPTLPPDGTILYDFSGRFKDEFTVEWAGTITEISNGSISGSPTCAGGQTGDAAFFALLTNCPSGIWIGALGDGQGDFNFQERDSNGSISLFGDNIGAGFNQDYIPFATGMYESQQSVPEPSTTVLVLIGLGWLIAKTTTSNCCRGRR